MEKLTKETAKSKEHLGIFSREPFLKRAKEQLQERKRMRSTPPRQPPRQPPRPPRQPPRPPRPPRDKAVTNDEGVDVDFANVLAKYEHSPLLFEKITKYNEEKDDLRFLLIRAQGFIQRKRYLITRWSFQGFRPL